MRRHHFELLQPVCPVCLQAGQGMQRLQISHVDHETADKIWEGQLSCGQAYCGSEFPILDGILILLPNLRAYVSDQIFQILCRDDLSPASLSLIGDCCSQNSHLDLTRQHTSCYVWDHYGEFDPAEVATPNAIQPGSVVQAIRQGMAPDVLGELPDGPVLDAGCSVGRSTFELAELTSRDVLGIDLNYSMLRIASNILRSGQVIYSKRRNGLVYEPRRFQVDFKQAHRVDFWICDAQALPFAPQSFAAVLGMNLLDSVPAPSQLVNSFSNALKPGASMLLATPFDWSTAVTPVEAWLGGHSQRGLTQGENLPIMQSLLEQAGFEITHHWPDVPWNVRLHDRSSMAYRLHMVHSRRLGS